MKKLASIIVILTLIAILPLSISTVSATYDDGDCDCNHMQYLGQGYEWTPYDEFTGAGVGAWVTGSGWYYDYDIWLSRGCAYALGPAYAEGYMNCYIWAADVLDIWPMVYENDNWGSIKWLDNTVTYPNPTGQYYYTQEYDLNGQWTTNEIWVVSESWFHHPYEGDYWLSRAVAHIPGGY